MLIFGGLIRVRVIRPTLNFGDLTHVSRNPFSLSVLQNMWLIGGTDFLTICLFPPLLTLPNFKISPQISIPFDFPWALTEFLQTEWPVLTTSSSLHYVYITDKVR